MILFFYEKTTHSQIHQKNKLRKAVVVKYLPSQVCLLTLTVTGILFRNFIRKIAKWNFPKHYTQKSKLFAKAKNSFLNNSLEPLLRIYYVIQMYTKYKLYFFTMTIQKIGKFLWFDIKVFWHKISLGGYNHIQGGPSRKDGTFIYYFRNRFGKKYRRTCQLWFLRNF